MVELRVVTINIWNRQGPWPVRKKLLRAGLAALEPDIIGMQEVVARGTTTQAHELVEDLGHQVAFGKARPLDDTADYGNAITSRFPIVSQKVFDLPCLDVDEPRSMLVVELDTPAGRLPVVVTHYSWRMEHGFVRERQSLAVADVLDNIPAACLPPLFMGDLNAGPDERELLFLTGQLSLDGRHTSLTDCFAEVGSGDGFTFDGRSNAFAEPWKEPPRRLDYILIDGPDSRGRGTPIAAEVVLTEVVDDVTASDHYGVLANIRY